MTDVLRVEGSFLGARTHHLHGAFAIGTRIGDDVFRDRLETIFQREDRNAALHEQRRRTLTVLLGRQLAVASTQAHDDGGSRRHGLVWKMGCKHRDADVFHAPVAVDRFFNGGLGGLRRGAVPQADDDDDDDDDD